MAVPKKKLTVEVDRVLGDEVCGQYVVVADLEVIGLKEAHVD